MPYKCLQPLTHDGHVFAPGKKITDRSITHSQVTALIELGVLEPEGKATESAQGKELELPDLQAMSQKEALDLIAKEGRLFLLHLWQEEEKRGRRRTRVLGALKREILTAQ